MSTYPPSFLLPDLDRPAIQQPSERHGPAKVVPQLLDLRPPPAQAELPHAQSRRDRTRLRCASWAFSTRRVPKSVADRLLPPMGKPAAGELVLARVDAIGFHSGLQLASGRRRTLFVGDEIVVAYGNRYASSQFKSFVPESLGPCHLVAGGGIASRASSWHDRIAKGPTHITPIGMIADGKGRRINLQDFGLPWLEDLGGYRPTTIAVVGTAMDAGKTQTAAFLARGLIDAGLRVGYAKITGTGAGGDTWLLRDAGANPVFDFTDAGLATTYLASPQEVTRVLMTLVAHTARAGVDALVMEIADGVYQRETSALLSSVAFAQLTGGIVLAASDSMAASAGFHWLKQQSTPVLALSGVLTASPLQVEEATEVTGLPIFDREGLATAGNAMAILGQAQHHLESIVPGFAGFGNNNDPGKP